MRRIWVGAMAIVLLSGCGEGKGPTDSGNIVTSVNSMNESDIESGMISKDENISNESGNPWGEFLDAAERTCGSPPTGFAILSATLSIDEARSDVEALEEVFTGPVTVYLLSTRGSDTDAVRVDVAGAVAVSGTGPVQLEILAERSDLVRLHERLVGGDFHVGLEGSTIRSDADPFSVTAVVSLRARAFCD